MPDRTVPRFSESNDDQLLIVQTAFLGDVLLGIPLFKALRQDFPASKLVLLCRKGVGSFFLEAGLVDEIIEVDKKNKNSWSEAKARVAERSFRLLLCPHESFRSARFAAGVKADVKVGFKRFFNVFTFDRRIRRPLEAPEALRQLALLAEVSPKWKTVSADFLAQQKAPGGQGENGMLVPVPSEASMQVASLISLREKRRQQKETPELATILEPIADTGEPIIVLAPGSVWRTKQWTKEGFIQAGQSLSKSRGALTVIMGAKDEMALCEEISSAIPNSLSLAGRTSLFESAQLLALADLLICNDSGAMHLGAAAGVPIVTIFGPTVLEFGYRPWSNEARVAQISLPCRPCGKHGAQKCPIGTHQCMRDVSTAAVLELATLVSNRER